MIKHLQLATLLTLFITSCLEAQTFTNLHSGFPSLTGASSAWADYDGDDDLDLAMVGFSGVVAEVGSIYRNDGNGLFALVKSLEFPVSNGAVNWGDYDHDGDPDLLVNGQGGFGSPAAVTMIYNNSGNDLFIRLLQAFRNDWHCPVDGLRWRWLAGRHHGRYWKFIPGGFHQAVSQ
jgi:hypothetical protein